MKGFEERLLMSESINPDVLEFGEERERRALVLFQQARYADLITEFAPFGQLTPRELALLGIGALRLDRNDEAEDYLLRAHLAGDLEATVEYGNVLRVTGRFEQAVAHFEQHQSLLSGELVVRAERWRGVAEFRLGQVQRGFERCERAWHGYLRLGDKEKAAEVLHNLGLMHHHLGNDEQAVRSLKKALQDLPAAPDPSRRLITLNTLAGFQLGAGQYAQAAQTLAQAEALLPKTSALSARAMILATRASLHWYNSEFPQYRALLHELLSLGSAMNDASIRRWAAVRYADALAARRQHSRALNMLHSLPAEDFEFPEVISTRGLLAQRRGDFSQALEDFNYALALFEQRERKIDYARTKLYLAHTQYLLKDSSKALSLLRDALEIILQLRMRKVYRDEFAEMSELLHFAALQPNISPLLGAVLETMGGPAFIPTLSLEQPVSCLHVQTLGCAKAMLADEQLRMSGGSLVLLAYLALQPNRTRHEIQLDLYPDKNPEAASSAVRVAIHEIRRHLGPDAVVHEGPYRSKRYRLGSSLSVETDFDLLREALQKGELPRAFMLYQGPFLPDFEGSEWVDARRQEARLGLLSLAEREVCKWQDAAEWSRVVLVCDQVLQRDVEAREFHLARLEAAQKLENAQLSAQFQAELGRLDGFDKERPEN